jgi:hypothetical protein
MTGMPTGFVERGTSSNEVFADTACQYTVQLMKIGKAFFIADRSPVTLGTDDNAKYIIGNHEYSVLSTKLEKDGDKTIRW